MRHLSSSREVRRLRGETLAPPRSYGTTAISELALFTELDGPGGAERLVAEVARAADCAARVPALVALGAGAVLPTAQALIELAAGGQSAAGRPRAVARSVLVDALTRLERDPKNPIVIEALIAAVAGASEKEEQLLLAALRRTADPPVAALATLLNAPGAPAEDRAQGAARLLGALDDRARDRGADRGRGAADRRPSETPVVIAPRAARPSSTPRRSFSPPLRAAATPTGRPISLRVVPPLVRRAPEASAPALVALRASLPAERPFEVRARAVMALGALGGAGLPALADVRARADEPVLRHLAARELAAVGGAEAARALRAALADVDPRVRATAAEGLGQAHDAGASPALIAGAKQEPWPFVRRAEIEALGRLCGAGGADLLVRAVERDVAEVRRASLVGLARCKDPRAQTLAAARSSAAWQRRPRPCAKAGGGAAGRARRARGGARHGRRARAAGQRVGGGSLGRGRRRESTLRSLARLRAAPDATKAAVTLAKRDTRHPFQSTAVEALGLICEAQARARSGAARARGWPRGLARARGAEREQAMRDAVRARRAPPTQGSRRVARAPRDDAQTTRTSRRMRTRGCP